LLAEIEEKQNDLSFLEEPTAACWKFLSTRFLILKKSAENAVAATLKNVYGGQDLEMLPRVTTILLQLLKNEQKVLEMLFHCANDHLNTENTDVQ
jgi:hypothetical protein